ncbi:hypothetical protein T4B_4457 [Trichinella pseudospiralis]|uniref:Uncharacterized protein n=1 Tax=Trichinella pseudospiralis TaxID=6337 RepID=A0A0V1IGI6_TRIPS|nr:hypothetical protein T4B_4457 [Trichinella pseudospiralis]
MVFMLSVVEQQHIWAILSVYHQDLDKILLVSPVGLTWKDCAKRLNHTNCKRASQSVHSGRDNAVILLKKKTKLNCNLASISSLKLRTDNSPDSAFFSCNNEKYSTTNVG